MIQIIDGFKLNASTPIDSRFVVADDTERNNITYLYHGLRVWQKNTNTPWFYDGTQWVSELDLVVTGSGTVNSIPKVTSSSPLVVGDSQISDDGTIVNITNDLTVGNNITFSGILNGTIDANNITTGILSLNRLQTGTNGHVLQMIGTNPAWVDLNTLSIGTSTRSDTVKISSTNSSNSYRLVLMEDGGTLGNYNQLYSKNAGIKVKEDGSSNLRILAHDGAVDRPPYSFDSSPTSGIWYSTGGINLSINSNNKARFYSSGIFFYDKTQFNFTNTDDKLYIYDSSAKSAEESSLEIKQPNATKNSIAIDMLFNSGSNKKRMIMSPYVSNGGYSYHSNENDSIIKVTNPNGVLLLGAVKNSSSSGKWDSIRIWEGKLQIGAGNKGSENYSVHIKENSTVWSLVVDKTFFVKPGKIQMLRKTYEQFWVGTNQTSSGFRWIANKNDDLSTSVSTMGSEDCDRIITIMFPRNFSDSDVEHTQFNMYVENGEGTDEWYDTNLSHPDFTSVDYTDKGFLGGMNFTNEAGSQNISAKGNGSFIFVPAGCRWRARISMYRTGSSGKQPKAIVTIQRFGL